MPTSNLVEFQELRDTVTETQYNLARINAFRLVALEMPSISFYCQTAILPEARLSDGGNYNNPFNPLPLTGTSLGYGELQVSFLVDEQFHNFRSMYNWLAGIAFPQSHEQFDALVRRKTPIISNPNNTEAATRSQLDLIMLDSMDKPIVTYSFHDAFPVSLASLPFDVTITDTKYFSALAGFKFSYYTISDAGATY